MCDKTNSVFTKEKKDEILQEESVTLDEINSMFTQEEKDRIVWEKYVKFDKINPVSTKEEKEVQEESGDGWLDSEDSDGEVRSFQKCLILLIIIIIEFRIFVFR